MVRQESERRQFGIEYQAFQTLIALVDVHSSGQPLTQEQLTGIIGFGLYASNGSPLYRQGSAPVSLSSGRELTEEGYSKYSGNSIVIVRRLGEVRPFAAENRLRPMRRMMMGERAELIAFLEMDATAELRNSRLMSVAAFFIVFVFIGITVLVLSLARKLSAYRERERETEHLVRLGEAARTLAHEVKNPLSVIRLQCATLKRTISGNAVKSLDVIEEETQRLDNLANRLRDYLYNSEGSPEVFGISSLMSEFAQRYGGRLNIETPDRDASVYADRSRISQVLDNLISNAFEAGDDTPLLSVSLHRNMCELRVSDTGSGVPPLDRKRLFEPFFTTKAKGSGIGLALSKRFMIQAGGSLTYENRPEGGSVFIATLPVHGGLA